MAKGSKKSLISKDVGPSTSTTEPHMPPTASNNKRCAQASTNQCSQSHRKRRTQIPTEEISSSQAGEISPSLSQVGIRPEDSSSSLIENNNAEHGGELKGEVEGVYVGQDKDVSGPPFPGGPENDKLLTSYMKHIARSIWLGKDRPLLRCQQHACKLESWNLDRECNRFREKFAHSGLGPLVEITFKTVNRTLICGMVERWYSETNTFHLPVGEMTITLDDVSDILGIPVEGKAVCGASLNQNEIFDMIVNELGIPREEVSAEFKGQTNVSIRLEFLRDKLHGSSDEMTDVDVDRRVKGYLLYLLGCTLFADKTGTKVSVMYLHLLRNLDDVCKYAWGAAGLAYLYRHLGSASKAKAKQIAGYLTLLQAWVYEHILAGRPTPDHDYVEGRPRALRWKQARLQPSMQNTMSIDFFRHLLDGITSNGVVFDPYTDLRSHHPIAYYCGCLICFDILEPYNPDRVLRQFGFIQTIPPDPLRVSSRTKRGYTAKEYMVIHELQIQNWQRWRNHLLSPESRGSPIVAHDDSEPGYLKWFKEVSHVRVLNPEKSALYRGMQEPISIDVEQPDDSLYIMADRAIQLGEKGEYEEMISAVRALRERLRGDDQCRVSITRALTYRVED